MARALWQGAISFGLVHVPVALHSAAKPGRLDLDLLDRRTMDPIGYAKVNKRTGKEVPREEMVKGYEYEKGRYVVLGDEDLRRTNPTATQTVEIMSFVDPAEIPVLYYDTPYYLVPGKRGEKAYALLRESMKRAGCIAIATVVIQTKQHLAAVLPTDRLLVLNTLRFADEIRDTKDLEVPAAGVKDAGVEEKELKVALQLVESMAGHWQPDKYHDTYREDVLARIEKKVKAGKTEEVAEPEEEAPKRAKAEVIDLMSLLQNSLRKGATRDRRTSAGHAAAGRRGATRATKSHPHAKKTQQERKRA